MWWEQEWHVWIGLLLGLAGLGVGIGAWVHAARASITASAAKNSINEMKADLAEKLARDKVILETEPVVPRRASLGLGRSPDGDPLLTNFGEGVAHDVQIVPAGPDITVLGRTSWSRIEVGESVPFRMRFTSPLGQFGTLDVSWIENASEERSHREIHIPNPRGVL